MPDETVSKMLQTRAIDNFSGAMADLLEALGWDGSASSFTVEVKRGDGLYFGSVEVKVMPVNAVLVVSGDEGARSLTVGPDTILASLRRGRAQREARFAPVNSLQDASTPMYDS